jgi:hypothetical protein
MRFFTLQAVSRRNFKINWASDFGYSWNALVNAAAAPSKSW